METSCFAPEASVYEPSPKQPVLNGYVENGWDLGSSGLPTVFTRDY